MTIANHFLGKTHQQLGLDPPMAQPLLHLVFGGEIAEQSQVIESLTKAFLASLGPDDPDLAGQRARWLVRVMTSLLLFPGHNEADERSMLEQFVVPAVLPVRRADQAF